ncbi:hypothetical protein AMTR_s00118p00054120 [Amborella trichopoda]|uniref:Uncharacterized protein n=1 Tax=Amborella trichopoda TaxID=13333 RepID=W1NSI2_AMBTC|nr:hypothetical protein AMTR_s00118p00054120 [Amborella trichopoda]
MPHSTVNITIDVRPSHGFISIIIRFFTTYYSSLTTPCYVAVAPTLITYNRTHNKAITFFLSPTCNLRLPQSQPFLPSTSPPTSLLSSP